MNLNTFNKNSFPLTVRKSLFSLVSLNLSLAFLFALAMVLYSPHAFAQSPQVSAEDEVLPSILELKTQEREERHSDSRRADDLDSQEDWWASNPTKLGTLEFGTFWKNGNREVSDPSMDYIQTFESFRPSVHALQAETSIAVFGKNIVIAYNDIASDHDLWDPVFRTVYPDRFQAGAYSVSNDHGVTFKTGHFPPVPGAKFTFGDPSVGVDRRGHFYFAQLGEDSSGNATVQVNSSLDGGRHWGDAIVAAVDHQSDKSWLAVGPDPFQRGNDNLYVTWTSFQTSGSQLRMSKSEDGGNSWTASTIFAPARNANPAEGQNQLQYSTPVVDSRTGKLYIPFVHFTAVGADLVRILISEDAGVSFHFATFNVANAPDAYGIPVVRPGTLADCGNPGSGFRYILHAGSNIGGGRSRLPRYIQSQWITPQPTMAALNGVLYLAWAASDSTKLGSATSGSNIFFTRSDDEGQHWTFPIQVNPVGNPRQIHPVITIGENDHSVHIAYYAQHADGTLDIEMASSLDNGTSFPPSGVSRVTDSSMTLPPSNIPIPSASQRFKTTNFDDAWPAGWSLGDYFGAQWAEGKIYVAWGDSRRAIQEPVDVHDPISGTIHPQSDVAFQIVQVANQEK